MSRLTVKDSNARVTFQRWRFRRELELEHQKEELQKEKLAFEKEQRRFEQEKREYDIWRKFEDGRLKNENRLFQMKWKILEDELKKLADEKKQIEKQKNLYRFRGDDEKSGNDKMASAHEINGMFFVGVGSKPALKRRYRELIRIYHPDNLDGDTRTLQEINREYDRLKAFYQ